MKKSLLLWIPPILWALVIFNFSANPTGQASVVHWQDFLAKKVAHVLEYGIFAVLLYRAMTGSGLPGGRAVFYSVIIALLYGLSDEFHQSFTPGRQPAVRDVIIDTIGACIATISIWKLLPKMPLKVRRLAKNLQLV